METTILYSVIEISNTLRPTVPFTITLLLIRLGLPVYTTSPPFYSIKRANYAAQYLSIPPIGIEKSGFAHMLSRSGCLAIFLSYLSNSLIFSVHVELLKDLQHGKFHQNFTPDFMTPLAEKTEKNFRTSAGWLLCS